MVRRTEYDFDVVSGPSERIDDRKPKPDADTAVLRDSAPVSVPPKPETEGK